MMISRVLVANRGEIAVRIIRACREMGIAAIAVYSEADRNALHVRQADQAIFIGPAPAVDSYLSVEKIIQAAREGQAQAIHPGYGFLSENAGFAQAVEDAGLVFIGPPPSAIQAMGDKAQARKRMLAAGVPVVPGYDGPDDDAFLAEAAPKIGYPLLVKAAAGGGGKGMRLVWNEADLTEAVNAARREAERAFGSGRLLLEHYVPRAHHVEFQILADQDGRVLHLFERECSVQRRHQKIIEETPSPLLTPELRERMAQAAVVAAQAVGYQNAGTIEFIVDPETLQFYFLEMNTRLQVEHPITEMVTGLDLVQWQIRIAGGEPLPFSQEQVTQRGHAIECRLYAEDPAHNFLPVTGPLLKYLEPHGPGVRTDSGVTSGDEITMHYDPLIAKVIVLAEDRPAAIQRMQAALCRAVLLGLTTNWPFLQDVLAHPDFKAGRVYTTWVEDTFPDWQPPQCDVPPEILAAAALTQFADLPAVGGAMPTARDRFSPWKAANEFRMGQ